MFRFPLGIGESRSLVQSEVVRRPTPPAHQRRRRGSGMMNLSNQRSIGFQLLVIIRGQTEEHGFRGKLCTRSDRQAQLDVILRRRMLQRILLCHLSRSGRIDLVGGRTGCIPGSAGKVKTQNGEKPLRSQRAKKQALMTSAIVDELTADGAMHLLFGIRKILDGNGWPVLAETVGKNSIVDRRSSEINNRSFRCFQRTDALDMNGLFSRISNRYLDIAKRLARVSSQVINQIWLPAQSRVGRLPVCSFS